MGWLEVLALLKRMMPLLSRVAPMLETFLATRGGARTENTAALEQVAGDLKVQLAAAAGNHDALATLLEKQGTQIAALASSVRLENDRMAASLLETETAVRELSLGLRKLAILLVILLAACLGLLIAILLHRP